MIAGKLKVATLLEGSVRKAGKGVRITAQLIRVADNSHLWSKTYDRELDGIFEVQDDIAQSVVKELRTALMGGDARPAATAQARAEVKAATVGRTGNAQAYELYLQGRFCASNLKHRRALNNAAAAAHTTCLAELTGGTTAWPTSGGSEDASRRCGRLHLGLANVRFIGN